MKRVWIAYEPKVFREALIEVISKIESIEIVEEPSDTVDIGIFRLPGTGLLQDFFHSAPMPQAKLVVFSPRGDKAFIRYPHEKNWTSIEPFSIPQLISEIKYGD